MYMHHMFGCGMSCRWPQKFELQMRAFRNSDRKSKTAVRSCAFPSPSLMESTGSSGPVNAETGTGKTMLCFGILAFEHSATFTHRCGGAGLQSRIDPQPYRRRMCSVSITCELAWYDWTCS